MAIDTDIPFEDGQGNVHVYKIDLESWAKDFFSGTREDAKKLVLEDNYTLGKIKIVWNRQNKRIQQLESDNTLLHKELEQLREENALLEERRSQDDES